MITSPSIQDTLWIMINKQIEKDMLYGFFIQTNTSEHSVWSSLTECLLAKV